jgi:hypothetical protein
MLYAGNNIKARRIFERTVKHRPPIRLTIRQGCGVLEQWPRRPKIDGDDGDVIAGLGRQPPLAGEPRAHPARLRQLFARVTKTTSAMHTVPVSHHDRAQAVREPQSASSWKAQA